MLAYERDYFCCVVFGINTNRIVFFTQNQDIISVTIDGSAPISGTISGNQIQLGGNLPQDGGVTTFSLSATVAGNCITGTSNWSWADQTSSCPVGQSSIEGTPTNDPNACTSAKPTTGGGGGGGSTGLWFLSVLLTVLCFRNRRIRMVLK